jgi:hypothetical protein
MSIEDGQYDSHSQDFIRIAIAPLKQPTDLNGKLGANDAQSLRADMIFRQGIRRFTPLVRHRQIGRDRNDVKVPGLVLVLTRNKLRPIAEMLACRRKGIKADVAGSTSVSRSNFPIS